MFDDLKKILNNIKNLNAKECLTEILTEDKYLQGVVIELNILEQLYFKGIDINGASIGEYSQITKNVYKPLAAAYGGDTRTENITLKDTGAFYNSFDVDSTEGDIIMSANDEHELMISFGEIIGLTASNKIKLVNEIYPELLKKTIEKIQE